jgi:hypothetical protein
VEADHRVITEADSGENENQVELVWRERLPLGLNLLLNDESGQVKVGKYIQNKYSVQHYHLY